MLICSGYDVEAELEFLLELESRQKAPPKEPQTEPGPSKNVLGRAASAPVMLSVDDASAPRRIQWVADEEVSMDIDVLRCCL